MVRQDEDALARIELLRDLGEGRRPQEQRVDDAEDRDAGPDAEPGDEDGERGEAGVTSEDAQRVPQILKELGKKHVRLDGRTACFVYGERRANYSIDRYSKDG